MKFVVKYIDVLYPQGTISGTVQDSQEQKLSGVSISFELLADLQMQTDADGNFSFQNIPPISSRSAKYTLLFNKTGYRETRLYIDLETGNNTYVDFELLTQEEFDKKQEEKVKADKTCWGVMMTLLFAPIGILQFRRKN